MLIKKLSKETVERHENLIREYLDEVHSEKDAEIELWGNGSEKGVYKVSFNGKSVLAAAGAIERTRSLLEEYNILNILHKGTPEYFPSPRGHYAPSNHEELGELMLMEFLPHLDLDRFWREDVRPRDFHRKLAYQIGKATAAVNIKTGRYSSEPHDGNILVRADEEGQLEIKFCDAIQFRTGSLDDAAEALLAQKDLRPESFRFIKILREGMAESMTSLQGISREEAYDRLDFLRIYNDVF